MLNSWCLMWRGCSKSVSQNSSNIHSSSANLYWCSLFSSFLCLKYVLHPPIIASIISVYTTFEFQARLHSLILKVATKTIFLWFKSYWYLFPLIHVSVWTIQRICLMEYFSWIMWCDVCLTLDHCNHGLNIF